VRHGPGRADMLIRYFPRYPSKRRRSALHGLASVARCNRQNRRPPPDVAPRLTGSVLLALQLGEDLFEAEHLVIRRPVPLGPEAPDLLVVTIERGHNTMNQANPNLSSEYVHGCPSDVDHDREVPEVDVLSPLSIRNVPFRNRIVMSPMCQYCAHEGLADDWHLVHLGSLAVGGVSLVMVEATAVTRDGRITHGDMGIWGDQHIEPLARIARFVHSQGAVAGIQLAHAGRKASCDVPWNGGESLKSPLRGWTGIFPTADWTYAAQYQRVHPHADRAQRHQHPGRALVRRHRRRL
jgi:hypothetical protein